MCHSSFCCQAALLWGRTEPHQAQQCHGDRLTTPTCAFIHRWPCWTFTLPAWSRSHFCYWYSDLPWQAGAVGYCLILLVLVWLGNSSAGKGVCGQHADRSSAADCNPEGGSCTQTAWTRAPRRSLVPPNPPSLLKALLRAPGPIWTPFRQGKMSDYALFWPRDGATERHFENFYF